MIVITKVAGEVNVYATLCLCLMILGVVCVVLLQCIYRVTKKPLETLDQTKECPKCHTINDKDANSARSAEKSLQNNYQSILILISLVHVRDKSASELV